MSYTLTTCPCCRSTVRIVPEEAKLEIVSIAKPSAAERWQPTRAHRPGPPTKFADHRNGAERHVIAVAARVAKEHGVSLNELRSSSRKQPVLKARHAAAAAARAETDASLPAIGRVLNRDHTTILNSLRRAESVA